MAEMKESKPGSVQQAVRPNSAMDMIETRLATVLVLLPPVAGVFLGGVLITVYRRLAGQLQMKSVDYVTPGLGIFSLLGLLVILYFSMRVYQGRATRFPRLLRVAPFTAMAGLVFGTLIAWLKATNRIH